MFGFPFLPGAAVEPDFGVLEPGFGADAVDGGEEAGEADAVGAVGVGEISGGVDLLGFHLLEEVDHDLDVGFAERIFTDFSGFVEGEVEEVEAVFGDAAVAAGGAGLAAADEGFDLLDLGGVDLAGMFVAEELFDVVVDAGGFFAPRPRTRVSSAANSAKRMASSSKTAMLPLVW